MMIQQCRYIAVPVLSMMLSIAAAGQSPAGEEPDKDPGAGAAAVIVPLPAPPRGKSSVIGGEIVSVNPVRDSFRLKVFGGKPLQILYDERTQVFRDGVRVGVLTLHPYDHASVETRLDGTRVFAMRIHMLSQLPDGECRGTVSQYDSRSGDLKISVETHQTTTVRVPPGTPVVQVGEDPANAPHGETYNFAPGMQVDVKFNGGVGGTRVATQVNIPASRGSGYVFSGRLTFFDLHSGQLVVANLRDNQTYEVAFDPGAVPCER